MASVLGEATELHPPDRLRPGLTLMVLSLGATAYGLLQSAVVPAIPDLQRSLHANETGVAWVLTAYLLSSSALTPVLGRLGDIYGKEKILLWAYTLLTVGTVMAAASSSLELLIVARVIQGVGGGIFPLAFGIIRDEFPLARVAGAIGLLSAVFGVGAGAGTLVGAVIAQHLDWHWLFWIPLVALVPAGVLTFRYVPESPVRTPGKINWVSLLLMSGGLTAVLIAISETTNWGWGSTNTVVVLGGGLALCALWVLAELRSPRPLVDMKMMRIQAVWTTNLAAFLLGAGMFASFIIIPQFVETPKAAGYGFGASIVGGGIYLLPTTIGMLITGALAGRVSARFGSKTATVVGAGFGVAAFALLSAAHTAGWQVFVAGGLLGAGIGLAFAGMANLIVAAVPPTQTGVASGMNTVMRSVGGAIGSQIAATMIAGHRMASGLPSKAGYIDAFALSASLMAVCLASSLAIRTSRQDPAAPPVAAQTAR